MWGELGTGVKRLLVIGLLLAVGLGVSQSCDQTSESERMRLEAARKIHPDPPVP